MTDRIAEQGAVLYGLDNPTSAGVSRLGAAGALQAAIADAIDNGFSSATASRLGGRGRLYALAAASAFSPLSLFSSSEVGVWYDPSDFSTMFQDSAGTTPVTAVGQPVGLLMDKSKGLVLGSERVGDLTILQARNANSSIISETSSEIVIDSLAAGTYGANAPTVVGVVGTSYWIDITLMSSVLRVLTVQIGGGSRNITLSAGVPKTERFLLTAPAATVLDIYASAGAAGERLTITALSVKSVAGNHATQATSTARPVTITNGIDCDGVDDAIIEQQGGGGTTGFFLCTAVRPDGGAGTSRTIWSDAGTNTGYIVRLNASNQLEIAAGNGTAYTLAATTDTLTVGTTYVVTAWDDGTNLNVQVNSGTAGTAARPVVSAGTSTATIGKDNGAASGFFNGAVMVGSMVYVKNGQNVDAADRTATKSYVANKAGVAI